MTSQPSSLKATLPHKGKLHRILAEVEINMYIYINMISMTYASDALSVEPLKNRISEGISN